MKTIHFLQFGRRFTALLMMAAAVGAAMPTTAAAATTTLVSQASNTCLDVPASNPAPGTGVEIWSCNGGSNQQWELTGASELRVLGGTRCLDASGGGTSAGTKVISYTCNGGANQKWTLTSSGQIVGSSGLCLDVTGGATADGTFVELWSCNGGSNQAWTKNGSGGGGGGGGSGDCCGASWNKQTTFSLVNNTHGAYPDSQVYWAIVGKDWNSGQFVHVDAAGHLVPMSMNDNGQLNKNGMKYSNYFHTLAEARQVTIPPINSARLMLSVGSPMYLQVQQDINGNLGYSGANIENPSDPNIDVYFDFVEMAIVPDSGIYANTTRVDQFGFPVQMRVQGLGNFDQSVGETENRAALISEYQQQVPADFQSLAGSHLPYRIVAPAHGNFSNGGAESHYLDGYINSLWNRYSSQTMTFTDQQGTFTGHVVNGQFQFTDGQGTYKIARAPSTSEVLLGNGVLNDPSGQSPGAGWDKQLQIEAQVCAAINRHVFEDTAHWANSSYFYPAGQAANWYAKFWHDHNINHLAYGFAYDDVSNFSSSVHTTAPTTVTVSVGW